jgi:hypothetical protein
VCLGGGGSFGRVNKLWRISSPLACVLFPFPPPSPHTHVCPDGRADGSYNSEEGGDDFDDDADATHDDSAVGAGKPLLSW